MQHQVRIASEHDTLPLGQSCLRLTKNSTNVPVTDTAMRPPVTTSPRTRTGTKIPTRKPQILIVRKDAFQLLSAMLVWYLSIKVRRLREKRSLDKGPTKGTCQRYPLMLPVTCRSLAFRPYDTEAKTRTGT